MNTATDPPKRDRARKSWREKLADDKDLPKIVLAKDEANARRFGGRRIAIARPRDVDALMQQVPRGKVTTIDALRAAIASGQQADAGCPITTGIFAWIAAHAAAEAAQAGARRVTPYWRTLKANGELNPKYPGGIETLRAKLEAEGHHIMQKRNRFFVRDYAKALFEPALHRQE